MNASRKKMVFYLVLFALLGGMLTIPFVWESPSMYYKTGLDRFLLRAGKMAGILAAVLLMLQPLMVMRSGLTDRLMALADRFRFHRKNALVLFGFALAHPILVLWADGFSLFRLEWRYWPEMAGLLLLFLLLLVIITSLVQQKGVIRREPWLAAHRFLAPISLLILFLHIYNVSKSFQSDLPFYILAVLAVLVLCTFTYTWFRRIRP